MASSRYSFIDVAVLEEVRTRFATGDALVLLNLDLEEVIWANGPGARLLGFEDIGAVMGASAGLGFAARRQIGATPGFPRMGRDKPVGVRLSSGLVSRAVTFLVSSVTLPDGEPALLLALPAQASGSHGERETANRAIEGFGEAGFFAALIDANGGSRAATPGFERLGLAAATIKALVDDVAEEADRLVKRLVPGAEGLLPAGIARLTDDPALHLLVAVDEPVEDEDTSETVADNDYPVAQVDSIAGATDDEPAAPSDADIPERVAEDASALAVGGAHGEAGFAAGADNDAVPPGQPDDWYFNGGDDQVSTPTIEAETAGADADLTTEVATEVPSTTPATSQAIGAVDATLVPPPAPRALHGEPVRFVWRTDAEGRFNSLSPEFVDAIGGNLDDLVGVPFAEVAGRLGLDPDGEIASLLGRRDTWSGRTVLWPVPDADAVVPVDLAALPVYNRERQFEGFRGFGVARLGDAVQRERQAPAAAVSDVITAETGADAETSTSAERPDAFQGEVPVISIAEHRERRDSDKVIRLAEHRTPQAPERILSPGERNAFEEIRARLQKDYEAASGDADPAGETPAAEDVEPDKTSAARHDASVSDTEYTVDEDDIPGTVEEPGTPDEPTDTDRPAPAPYRATFADFPEEVAEIVPADARERESDAGDEPVEHGDDVFDEPYLDQLDGTVGSDGDAEHLALAEPDTVDPLDQHRLIAEQADGGAGETEGVRGSETETGDQSTVDELALHSPVTSDVAAAAASTMPAAARHAPAFAMDGFTPSAFAGIAHSDGIDGDLVAGLPVAMLVHAGDDLYFANRAFLSLTGDASLEALRARGGLDSLFIERNSDEEIGPDGRKLALRTAQDETFAVDAHLQSIRWRDGSALLLTLQRVVDDRRAGGDTDFTRALEGRVAEMRTIIDTATDGVVLIDRDGNIRNISRPAEALFGFESDEVEGRAFETLFAIESRKSARDYLDGLAENGVASVLNDGREVIGREAEGRFIPLFMTIGRLPGESGYCAVVRDITQWKRAEEELTQARAQAERASSHKTEFLARVSHEIRTPLNAIIGFSELMIDEKFGPIGSDRYRDYLRDINRSGNHVLDLVNDLLDISKIEAGEQELNYEAVSLNDTLSESVAMMQPQANRDRVIIRSSMASRLPEVVADLRSVRQIALNLLSNAIRYTQPGGQVIVSTGYEPSGDVVMRVRDTGVGMTLAEIDQALKPFKQINALRRGRHDGTGLGLPLTKAMVEANRARFQITSTPGEGTMVEVTFPATRVLAN